MRDLTAYSDNELSLQVFNDEYFYIERYHKDYLLALVAEEFIYTQKQLETLLENLSEDARQH